MPKDTTAVVSVKSFKKYFNVFLQLISNSMRERVAVQLAKDTIY